MEKWEIVCVFNLFSLDQIKDQYKSMPDMLIQITGGTSIFSQSVHAHVHLGILKCLKPSCLSIIWSIVKFQCNIFTKHLTMPNIVDKSYLVQIQSRITCTPYRHELHDKQWVTIQLALVKTNKTGFQPLTACRHVKHMSSSAAVYNPYTMPTIQKAAVEPTQVH